MALRIHNFNPGPAALPLQVLEQVREEFTDFKGSGMSITEVSHRSAAFEEVLNDAVARIKRLLKVPDNYKILFLQGGASTQFCMVPMNLVPSGSSADYVNTGSWSKKAIKEAQILNKPHNVVASSEDRNFRYIPKNARSHRGRRTYISPQTIQLKELSGLVSQKQGTCRSSRTCHPIYFHGLSMWARSALFMLGLKRTWARRG